MKIWTTGQKNQINGMTDENASEGLVSPAPYEAPIMSKIGTRH